MTAPQRYRTGAYGAMVTDDNGPWVRWSDVAPAPQSDVEHLASFVFRDGQIHVVPGADASSAIGAKDGRGYIGREDDPTFERGK